jgi:hypothetical protein
MGITEEIVERSKKTEHGFRDLQRIADGLVTSGDAAFAKGIALELLRSDVHQARCVGTFVLGGLAALDADALLALRQHVS